MAESGNTKSNLFTWEGINRKGEKVSGERMSRNDSLIRTQLRKEGINPLKIKRKSPSLLGSLTKEKITPKDITVLSRQLATMMSAGVPLVQSFEIVGRGQENKSLQELIIAIRNDVEAGGTLNEALGKHPKHFNDLFVNLVAAGEHAGILENILNKLAVYLEKTEALKSKIKSALFYPTAVVLVALVITSILMIFVIPQFQSLFAGFGADLPALTAFVIRLSHWFESNWTYLFLGLTFVAISFVKLNQKSTRFSNFVDRTLLKIPIIGMILHKSAIARFARTLSTMFSAGTPLVEALSSVAGACGNIVYYEAVMRIREDVATGTQIQTSMRDTQVFPNMVVQMVSIGEESGALDKMLDKIADWYEQEVDDLVDSLTSLLEPIIMAVLGVIIGGLVIAMYLPIFQMGQVV